MQSNYEILKREFEKEMWLYLDDSLTPERKEFWNEKLIDFPELKNELDETEKALNIYNELVQDDLLDSKYETIITKSTEKKKNRFLKFLQTENRVIKLAFSGTLAAASIVILLFSNKPNPVKNISSDLLDWDAEKINTQIDDIGTTLLLIKDDEAKKYFQEKLANDKWTRDVYNINKSIQKMKNELEESSL